MSESNVTGIRPGSAAALAESDKTTGPAIDGTSAGALNQAIGDERQAAVGGDSQTKKAVKALTNSEEHRTLIFNAIAEIKQVKAERGELTARIRGIRETLKSKTGVHAKALDYVLWYEEASEEQREGLDHSYAMAREALGCPVQAGLFDDERDETDKSTH